MPRVTEEYRSAKRDEIAQAAMIAFQRKGFQGTSMADIIAEAGLSAGAIYGHYRSKSELVVDVAQRVVGARLDDVATLAAAIPMPPPANLVRVLTAGMLRDTGGTAMLVQLWGEAISDPEVRGLVAKVLMRLRDTYQGYISLWQQREHGRSAEEADAIAIAQCPMFLGAAQGYILQSALFPDFDGDSYLTTIETHLPR